MEFDAAAFWMEAMMAAKTQRTQSKPTPQLNVTRTIGNQRQFRDVDVTPPEVFFNRRTILKQMGVAGMMAGGWPMATACAQNDDDAKVAVPLRHPAVQVPLKTKAYLQKFPYKRSEKFAGKGVKMTDRVVAATHNNFYEFLPGRGGPVYLYTDPFKVEPWKIEITGACNKPQTVDLDDIFKMDMEERVYHFRCVETWAMDVPWTGFPLSALLKKADPKGSAKYVRFSTASDEKHMPGIPLSKRLGHGYAWPYHEALRMDEAMNELALMVTGIFGEPLLKQHGSPIRLIVPWKYGYKSPKSIVKIEFLEKKPLTFWARPPYTHEYGFLSNVNPNIPHPRWSQASEYMLVADAHPRGGPEKKTKLFNGYGDYVAKLYPDEPTKPQRALRSGETAR